MTYMNVKLEGGKELERKLKALEGNAGKKIVRKGVREGLKPTLQAAKANAKSMVGGEMGALLKKHLVAKVFRKPRPGTYGMAVELRAGVPEFVSETKKRNLQKTKKGYAFRPRRYYIPYAIEFGHAFPGRGGGKNPPKDVPAIPFMRTASDAQLGKGVKIFGQVVRMKIDEVARRGS